ncbi:MAG: glucosaminidase domain-containing protein [Polyangiaceae bacterium]|nr:glucosaminidase domain-containing protein [Polyangiaceae bacterium]
MTQRIEGPSKLPTTHQFRMESATSGTAERFGAYLPNSLQGARTPLSGGEASRLLSQAWERVHGTPPSAKTLSTLWAQWALETGRGRSMRGYNFGGIKGTAPGGGSAVLKTHEGYGDHRVAIQSRFRTYATPEAGAADYVRTLSERYPEATKAAASGDVHGFVAGLRKRGYFTADPNDYSRAIERLSAEHTRSGGGDFSQLKDPGPWVDALLHTLAQVIARHRSG